MNSAPPIEAISSETEIALDSLSKLSNQVDGLIKKGHKDDLSLITKKLKSLLNDIPGNSFDNARIHLNSRSMSEDSLDPFNLFLTALGERIGLFRRRLGITQLQLSQISGLDRAYLSSIENGRQNITVGAIFKIASALHVRIEDLLLER